MTARVSLAVALVLLISAAPVTTAASRTPTATAAPPPSLRIGFLQPIESLNPYIGINEPSMVLYSLLYDFPFSFDQNGSYVSNLITSATCDATCMNWTYTVRQGVYWSDGTELTARDVAFTWNYDSQNLSTLWAYEPYFNRVVQCSTKGTPCGAVISSSNPWNVTVYFQTPFVAGRDLMAPIVQYNQWHSISPACAGGTAGCVNNAVYQNPNPIGTGPFSADPNLYQEFLQMPTAPLHLYRNSHYHPVGNVTPNLQIQDIYLYVYSNPATMSQALELGNLDLAEFTRSTVGPVLGQPNILVQSALQALQTWNEVGISQIDTASADSKLNPARWDVNVRRAIAMATNKDYIVQTIYAGQGVRGDSLISPVTPEWWYDPVAGGDNLTFDIQAANALLNQSGYTTWTGGSFGNGYREATNPITVSFQSSGGCGVSYGCYQVENIPNVTKTIPAGTPLSFTLAVRPPSEFPEEYQTALFLQSQWARIGVNVTILVETTEDALTRDIYSGAIEMYIWYWSSDPDPNYMLSMESSWTLDGWNDNYWVNTSYNRYYLAQLADQGFTQRQLAVRTAEMIQYESASYLIYLYPFGEWGMRTDLWQGWGNWTAHPYRQLNVRWGANPLWFDLNCPSCAPIVSNYPPTPPVVNYPTYSTWYVNTTHSLSATSTDPEPTDQLNFTWSWGDGTQTYCPWMQTVANCTSAGYMVTASHAYSRTTNATTGPFTITVSAYDGYSVAVSNEAVYVNVTSPLAGAGTLMGLVTDAMTSAPISNAFVLVEPGAFTASTTSSGVYDVVLPQGTYTVNVGAPLYASQSRTGIIVLANGTTYLNVSLNPNVGWIVGAVTDAASGAGIPNAVVRVANGTVPVLSASTDATGGFNLTLLQGTYTVNVSAAGYGSASVADIAVTANQASLVSIVLVPTVNPIHVLVLPSAGTPNAVPVRANLSTPGNGTWTLQFGDGSSRTEVHGSGESQLVIFHAYPGEGKYTVTLTVTSGTMSASASGQAIADATPPVTTASPQGTAGNALWFRSAVTVTLTATDALSGVAATEYRVDGGSWAAYQAPFAITSDGTHTVEYASVDRAGNVENPHTLTVDIDSKAPSLQLTSPASGATVSSSSVTVAWTASDAGSGVASVEISVDNGTFTAATGSSTTLQGLGDGTHTVTLRVTDAAGNVATTSTTFTVQTSLFSGLGVFLLGGVAATVIVVAVVASLLLMRRRARPPGAGPMQPPRPPPT